MEKSLLQDCITCTTINAFKEHVQKHLELKHNNNSVTLDLELHTTFLRHSVYRMIGA